MHRRTTVLAAILAAILVPSQISCQFLDYETSDNVGLADNFQPSVKASCVGGTMTIRVDTKQPFSGIIHGPNRTEHGCSVEGRGGLKTYLRIDLSKTNGQEGSCGVKFNSRTDERKVAIAVRAHPTIELVEDRLYVVSCGRAGFQNSRNQVSIVRLKVALPNNPTRNIDTVIEGRKYMLRAEVLDHDPNFDIQVRRCFAFDETETSMQLVDRRGCSVERLISDFVYDKASGSAEAVLHSMFRLPHSNRTYFQCDVAICRGSCPRATCSDADSTQGDRQISQQLSTLDEQAEDPFERPEDDAVTTSTSVFVAQPGSEASAAASYCTGVAGLRPEDSDWLMWLCIAFGVLFAVMLLINIFLCSAMTCSCTKSEIIEKEPSIYDDYSMYDSQYGYANNGKAYGSESDYGSEYGVVEGGDHGRGHLPSETGTYHSKYSQSHHGSTMNRSRH